MAKRKPKKLDQIIAEGPTPEQLAGGVFAETWQIADGKRARAYRRVPVIDTLWANGKLSARQYYALVRYRDVASAVDRSPLPDSVGRMGEVRGTGGFGMPPALLRSAQELGSLERALGSLYAIARAIAVDDVTLSQWAMDRSGSTMRTREIGAKVITWFEPRRKALKLALVDIRMAGERLAAEIGA